MLEKLIPPEIKNDLFYSYLHQISLAPQFKNFLEIGASSGQGSTHAFVTGIRERKDKEKVKLFPMEISDIRFKALLHEYKKDSFVKAYRVSSISSKNFPTKDEIIAFYNNSISNIRQYPIETILSWYEEDQIYLELNSDINIEGIDLIKKENKISNFDVVLIDGSEFTGERDLYSTIGAKIIALDDINTFKNWNSFQILNNHSSYHLVIADRKTRNGFAIFERIY